MTHALRFLTAGVGTLLTMVWLTPVHSQAPQSPAAVQTSHQNNGWTLARTPDGQPDLQGIWSFATITPLERPDAYAGREFLTESEIAAANEEAATRADRRGATADADVAAAYNAFWWDRGKSTGRTSLIVDPPDGKVPPLTPEARQREAALAAVNRGRGPADSWEDRNLAERCIQYRPLPRLPTGYNNNYQIFQTPGYVVLVIEMIHDHRIIPLDGRPHLGQGIRLLNGDSRGRWEGDTLVVETTNFTNRAPFQGARENLHLVERFRRVGPDTIDYQFTVTDPTTWTRSWTGVLPLGRIDGPIYEYACHEGNLGMEGILAGARAEEQAARRAP
jgi:hypothetical protein